ncbi:hypothetical protein AGMMS49938_12260 [Fibrobacterales bacterium]|nr:hypothetical protein AGMMS49938_12260 [Fibrobacterales bacterium]
MGHRTKYAGIFGVEFDNVKEFKHFIKSTVDFYTIRKKLEENKGVAFVIPYDEADSYYLGFDLSYFCLEENEGLNMTEIQQKIIEKINSFDFIKKQIPIEKFRCVYAYSYE